ncbi:carboxypeptidase A1-like [Artemia franciscana]|uniref:carboxypeptidase A1-like n=1 Tax=Artemia franciscana TaxID=6661 RepID=UPI0032DA1D44
MKVLVVALLCLVVTSATVKFNGYEVIRVYPKTSVQLNFIRHLEHSGKYDFWKTAATKGFADIMASKENMISLKSMLRVTGIRYSIFISDVQGKIDQINAIPRKEAGPKSSRYALTWDNYYQYETIREFCYALAQDYPDLVTLEVVGTSLEGRELVLLKISSGGEGKPGIFVDGGTPIFTIEQFLKTDFHC